MSIESSTATRSEAVSDCLCQVPIYDPSPPPLKDQFDHSNTHLHAGGSLDLEVYASHNQNHNHYEDVDLSGGEGSGIFSFPDKYAKVSGTPSPAPVAGVLKTSSSSSTGTGTAPSRYGSSDRRYACNGSVHFPIVYIFAIVYFCYVNDTQLIRECICCVCVCVCIYLRSSPGRFSRQVNTTTTDTSAARTSRRSSGSGSIMAKPPPDLSRSIGILIIPRDLPVHICLYKFYKTCDN
jgi:hypothetical protein